MNPVLKGLVLIIVSFATGFFAGCTTMGAPKSDRAVIDQVLDAALPRSFVGDVHIAHKNPYFRGTLDAGNLHYGAAGWEYTWLVYVRDGVVSNGTIRLGKVPLQRLVP